MSETDFDKSVFINCPTDNDSTPLLEVIIFCIVYAGLKPRFATERLESGESRLDLIVRSAIKNPYFLQSVEQTRIPVYET